jgi:membrane protease YdiL (CAAX protease family)
MQKDARAYRSTLIAVWVVLTALAVTFSIQQHIPSSISVPFTVAALVEAAFYLAPGFSSARAVFESIQPAAARAAVLEASALTPYLIYSFGTGTFHWRSFVWLAVLTTAASAWYVLRTQKQFYADMLFLALMAAVLLLKVFPRIYIELSPRAPAAVLGQLMWYRTGILAVLSIRGMGGIHFGFLPTRKDWSIGIQQFVLFIPFAIGVGMAIRFVEPRLVSTVWWRAALTAAATFVGILWVVALSEEFFFRGMLQQMLAKKLGSTAAGLISASILFGLAHLWFRQFPNWKFAVLAALAGIFYGLAYIRAGSIRAAMVTHAMVVTTWRVFFA